MESVVPQLEAILAAAVEIASEDERRAFVERACAGDADLRCRVEQMIADYFQAGSFLETPARAVAATVDDPIREAPGASIGPYKLLEPIGEGGMGTVWMAQQTEPVKRLVALKLIKAGMDSKQVIARFEAERQALALMDHANIARVLDGGTTIGEPGGVSRGRPYFVMDLVKGVPITRYCDEHHLTPRQRLELFLPVCQAVQHAHQKGIIHRDLKPSNVLVALYDGKPVPKVIDFGVAKATGQQLTEKTLVTGFGNIVGTLEYMSPEQAEINQFDIDTRSDIYSLGVLLYELLTGSPPFTRKDLEKVGMMEMLRAIREQEPSKPSTKLSTAEGLPTLAANRGTEPAKLAKLVRGELDWIVMKALEKDRNRRYETANGFAADVQRYLADEAVQACPPSAGYRLRKFWRRNKRMLTMAMALTLGILVAVGSLGWTMRDRTLRREQAVEEAKAAVADVDQLRREGKWAAALVVTRRVQTLLGNGGNPELRRQFAELGHDLQMAADLEEIRLGKSEVKDGHFDWEQADASYAAAFRAYGIDVEALDAAEAADRIRTRTIPEQLAAALDDWANIRRTLKCERGAKRLGAVARAADPDPYRNLVREALEGRGQRLLEVLAASDRIEDLPPSTVVLLAQALVRTGLAERELRVQGASAVGLVSAPTGQGPMLAATAVFLRPTCASGDAVLRRAHWRYPADLWINHELAFSLHFGKPPRPGEAIRFYAAALALRPQSPGVWLNLGRAFSDSGNLPEAMEACRQAIRLDGNYVEAHNNLGSNLLASGRVDQAIAEYRKAIHLRKGYPLGHFNLANALKAKGRLDDAIAEYREAIRNKKNYVEAHNNLGNALRDRGRLDEAVAEYREAILLWEDYPEAHNNLGLALSDKGEEQEAITEFREAIRLNKDYAEAHYSLALALLRKGQLDEAIAEYREAIRLRGSYLPEAHYGLAMALDDKGQLEEAITQYQEAIRLKLDYAEAHCNLGCNLFRQGRFTEAAAALRRGHELGSRRPGWNAPSAWWLRRAERFVQLDAQLPKILIGQVRAKNASEEIEWAECASYKGLKAAAAGLYARAFAAEPTTQHRYDAACTAVLAGCGLGKDACKLTEVERARLRRQALEWLRAELAACRHQLARDPNKARPALLTWMQHWQQDADFAGVRGDEALAKLPEAERSEWQKLWADVEALRQRAADNTR